MSDGLDVARRSLARAELMTVAQAVLELASARSQPQPRRIRTGDMNFSKALEAIKVGHRVARQGWNGKGMFLFLVPGSVFKVNREPLLSLLGEGTEVEYHAHIDMKTAQGYVVPWLASQADLLADDWVTVL